MQEMEIISMDNGELIARRCYVADHFFTRLKGLLGKRELPPGEGLLIKPCNSVHTFGMKMSIDVVFLSEEYEVLHIMEEMPPGKMSPVVKKCACVLELPAGQVERTPILLGQHLLVNP